MKKSSRYGRFAVYLVVVVLINLVASTLFLRFDLTRNKVYSLSSPSKYVVSTLKEPLTVNVFFTHNLPSPYNTVEQYLKDLLGEYALHANRYFNYRFYDVSAEGEIDAARTAENRKLAGSYGINPVQIQVIEQDEMKFKKAYMGLVLIHGDMIERIPTLTTTDGLEYKLTTSIERLNNKISVLLGLKGKIKVKLYLSSSISNVSQRIGIRDLSKVADDVKKTVDDLNARMYGKVEYSLSDPASLTEMTDLSRRFNLMMLKWPALEEGRIPAGAGVIGIVTEYGGKSYTFPVLQAENLPLFGTQYRLTDMQALKEAMEQGIETLIGINESLGILTGKGTLELYAAPGASASLANFNSLASKCYSIKDINLKKGIPDGLTSLLIVRPTEPFSDYELYQIDQALMKGTNLAIFLDPFKEAAPAGSPYAQQAQLVPVSTGLEKLLDHYGVKVNQSLVLDEKCFKQRVPDQFGGGEQAIYYAPLIKASQINSSIAFMKNIKELITYKIAPLSLKAQIINGNRLKALRLFSSSDRSWEMKGQMILNPMFIRPPESGEGMTSRPLAYVIEGSFPSYFKGKPVPESPADEQDLKAQQDREKGNEKAVAAKAGQLERKGDFRAVSRPARIFIIGSSEMLTDNLISEQGDNPNATFIMNVIDSLNNKEDMALMRSKIQSFNPLMVKDEKIKITSKLFNIVALPVIVVAFGMFMYLRQRRRRRRIEAAFQDKG